MEDYLRWFRLGPRTQELAWLDCGSGADGLDRAGSWDRTARTGSASRSATRSASGWRRASRAARADAPGVAAVGGGGVPSAAAVAGVAGRGGPLGGLRSGAGEDYTYGRPSRRSASLPGVVLPSLRRRPPRVCVVIDTSGSVSDAELGSALLEVAAISRAVGGRRDLVSVVPCDAAARVAHPLCRAEGIRCWAAAARTCAPASPRRCAAPARRRRRPDRRPDPWPETRRRAGRWWAC
jgi:hypothetical protein